MNEKTKTILTHIGYALGGMALGIALLGGLSYCSTANKATTESVNTILTKKNQAITTDGGYRGYQFSVYSEFDNTTLNDLDFYWHLYDLDSNYTPTEVNWDYQTMASGYNAIVTRIKNLYNSSKSETSNKLRFLACYFKGFISGTSQTTPYMTYFTFVPPTGSSYQIKPLPFIYSNKTPTARMERLDQANFIGNPGDSFLINDSGMCPYFIVDSQEPPISPTFQDVITYYKSTAYQDGYEDGEATGYNSGYEVGYSDGSETGRMFTALGLNQTTWYKSDLTPTSTSETSNFYKLLEFKDGDNEEWGVAAELFTTNDLFKVDLYKNINQGYTSATYYGTLGEGTMTYVSGVWQVEMTPATYYFYEWAQITEVYNNSLPLNYFLLTGTPQNATGYQQGYQAGYQAGILATPGGEATNNVFSLFTSAFDSVGGFFNLKIFGFLPLYWFFLAPLFVALITLLLRMVKH